MWGPLEMLAGAISGLIWLRFDGVDARMDNAAWGLRL